MMELRPGKTSIKREEPFHSGSGFPIMLAAPALRALANAGYTRLEQLALVSEDDVKKLHGIGPNAVKLLIQALREKGLSFKK
jgi:hypothetical protein